MLLAFSSWLATLKETVAVASGSITTPRVSNCVDREGVVVVAGVYAIDT